MKRTLSAGRPPANLIMQIVYASIYIYICISVYSYMCILMRTQFALSDLLGAAPRTAFNGDYLSPACPRVAMRGGKAVRLTRGWPPSGVDF